MSAPLPPSLYDLADDQLASKVAAWGEPAFRTGQIRRWLYQRFARDVDEMTDLGKDLRARIKAEYAIGRFGVADAQRSTDGWTRKWLLKAPDGSEIETVLMEYEGARRTACVSSQAGCAMNCSFCATGQMGFQRNLRAGEIIEQVLWVERVLGEDAPAAQPVSRRASAARYPRATEADPDQRRLTNVVLMGMGEPFANYSNVMEAVRRLIAPAAEGGLGLGQRRITISTVGVVPGIRKFALEDLQVNLAVSLHAATDDLRNRLVPINEKYPLRELARAMRDYIVKTNRRVSIEWALIDGVNDTPEQARALVDFARQTFDPLKEGRNLLHINMIPLNPTRGYTGRASLQERRSAFQAVIEEAGLPNTMRVRRGIDIAAGCGQLRERAAQRAPKAGKERAPRV